MPICLSERRTNGLHGSSSLTTLSTRQSEKEPWQQRRMTGTEKSDRARVCLLIITLCTGGCWRLPRVALEVAGVHWRMTEIALEVAK